MAESGAVRTFAEAIEEQAGGEPILAVVIGERGTALARKPVPAEVVGRVLSWDEAKPYLEYPYDAGGWTTSCHPVYAWTENWVLMVATYDGIMWVARVPRHPVACQPEMVGGEA